MKTKILITVFVLVFVFFAVLIVMPADVESVLSENREPAKMPEITFESIISGEFFADFETYLSDNIGLRGKLIAISNKFNSLKGIKSYGYISEVNADLGTGDVTTQKGLLIANDKIMEIYKVNPEFRDNYVAMINHYAEKLPEDINLYSMIIPTQIEFSEKQYKELADSQKDTIEYIYSKTDERVNCVDAYSALLNHKDEYIYFKTDHHWTTLGAYYAYREFAKAAGVNGADIGNFEEKKAENFLGYLYNQAQATELKDKPDTIYYYTDGNKYPFDAWAWENGEIVKYKGAIFNVPEIGVETKYSLFMGGDHSLLDLKSDVNNGICVLVLKDSYANAFMPWLVNSFERVVAVDPRSFGGNISDIVAEYGVTDVLLMNYTLTTNFNEIIQAEMRIFN